MAGGSRRRRRPRRRPAPRSSRSFARPAPLSSACFMRALPSSTSLAIRRRDEHARCPGRSDYGQQVAARASGENIDGFLHLERVAHVRAERLLHAGHQRERWAGPRARPISTIAFASSMDCSPACASARRCRSSRPARSRPRRWPASWRRCWRRSAAGSPPCRSRRAGRRAPYRPGRDRASGR